jgi:hypothetical protein
MVTIGAPARAAVNQAGLVTVVETIRATGLDRLLTEGLAKWDLPRATHKTGKVLLDLALAVIAGGDQLADAGLVRGQPDVFGQVASEPVVSRTIARLAGQIDQVERQVAQVVAEARQTAWRLAGDASPVVATPRAPLVIDIDATLVQAHSDKEGATGTWKHTFGFHPLCAFIDYKNNGGEPAGIMLRPGRAGSNTAKDHTDLAAKALLGLPAPLHGCQARDRVLIRTDSAGATHKFVNWLAGRKSQYSIGFTIPWEQAERVDWIPPEAWTPAYDDDGGVKPGAFVAEATGVIEVNGWPKDMRIILRKERPHPGAQLTLMDWDGNRVTAFITNTRTGQLPDLELRHRQRAHCEDRVRCGKQVGLAKMPLQGFAQNRIWCLVVQLANTLIGWMQLIGCDGLAARRWEPKRLRARLFSTAGQLVRHARQTCLRFARHTWTDTLTAIITRLRGVVLVT